MLKLATGQSQDTLSTMTEAFVIRNQLGHFWGKSKVWVDGSQPRLVFRVRHRDEAVNSLFELSSRDIDLRGEVLQTELSERGEPVIEASQIPLPIAPEAGEESADTVESESTALEHPSTTEPAA
jgi:hypothetical protein